MRRHATTSKRRQGLFFNFYHIRKAPVCRRRRKKSGAALSNAKSARSRLPKKVTEWTMTQYVFTLANPVTSQMKSGQVYALTRVLRKTSVSVSKESKAIALDHRYLLLSNYITPSQVCQIRSRMSYRCGCLRWGYVVTSVLFVCKTGLKHMFHQVQFGDI